MTSYVCDAIFNAISFIEENLTSNITIEDMANAAGYSAIHFSRTFNEVTGHSPYDYLIRRKLSEAAFDVLEEKEAFNDIALKYQFSSFEVFASSFQKLFGHLPSEFREVRKVHMLQWKRRFSADYLSHLNEHDYMRPARVNLDNIIVGGHIINDRHFFDSNGKRLSGETEEVSYIHLHREHRHLHEYAFMKGAGVLGRIIKDIHDAQPDMVCKPVETGQFLRFDYTGSYFQIQNVYTYIFETWMPQTGMSVEVPYVFERILKSENKVEIYVPIVS